MEGSEMTVDEGYMFAIQPEPDCCRPFKNVGDTTYTEI
jgi:hypothetical protein